MTTTKAWPRREWGNLAKAERLAVAMDRIPRAEAAAAAATVFAQDTRYSGWDVGQLQRLIVTRVRDAREAV